MTGSDIAESRLRSDGNLVESRLGLDEVPQQISRILFGNNGQSTRPNYNGNYNPPNINPGYGVPSSPTNGFSSPFFYEGYVDDIYLLIKLGQVCLVLFILLSVAIILALLITCCCKLFKKDGQRTSKNPPYIPPSEAGRGAASKGGLTVIPVEGGRGLSNIDGGRNGEFTRSKGFENLTVETSSTTSSAEGTSPQRGVGGRSSAGRRSRSRLQDRNSSLASSSMSEPLPPSPTNITWGHPNPKQESNAPRTMKSEPPIWNQAGTRPTNEAINRQSSEISQNRSMSYYEVPHAVTTFSPMSRTPGVQSQASANPASRY